MISKRIRFKKGYGNTAIYDFENKCVYLINKADGDALLSGSYIDKNNLYQKLRKLNIISDEDNCNKTDMTFFDYELFSDAFSYNKCTLLYFEITDHCNFNCLHCYADVKCTNNHYISIENARSFLKKIAQKGPCDIRITGGEPFIHKEIMTILESVIEIVKPRTRHSIATNGSFSLAQAESALQMGFELQISMYGTTPSEFSEFTGLSEEYYKNLIHKINALAKKQYAHQITLAFAINNLTYKSLDKMVAYSKSQQLSYILNRTASAGRANTNLNRLQLKGKDNLKFAALQGRPIPSFCYHLCQLYRASLHYNGDLTPCPYLRSEQFIMGNLANSSFEEIWQSEQFNQFRSYSAEDVEYCNACEFEFVCTAGCCGETLAYSGNMLNTYPWCDIKPYLNPDYLHISHGEVYRVKKLAAGILDFSVIE